MIKGQFTKKLTTKGGIHYRIECLLGMPNKCEKCGSTTAKRYDWANIDHTYTLELSKWIRLCRSCHQKMDFIKNNRTRQFGSTNAIRKQVTQISIDGEINQLFQSISEASKKTGVSRTSIINNLKKRAKTAGGFIWKY